MKTERGTALRRRTNAVLVAAALAAAACSDGGDTTAAGGIFATMGEIRPSATAEQRATFERGLGVARHRFTDADGLGPDFNVVSCANCHEKPVTGGGAGRYRDFLLVRAVLGDGSSIATGVNGVQPQYTLGPEARRPTDAATNLEANRNPIPFFGVGLLAEIPEGEILSREDPDDIDRDGISGRANYDRGFVGRFGRKAQTVSIEGFIRGPLFNHLGVTSNPLSDELKAMLPVPSALLEARSERGSLRSWLALLARPIVTSAWAQVAAPEEPNFDDDVAPDPELSEADLFDLVSFAMLLAAPTPDPPTARTRRGEQHFTDVGCAGCHVPALAGPRGAIPAYTDLLLHDMGPELADGLEMGLASGSEFRTQPLWGVAAVAPYLHDGRADTLDEAIRAHGGEADAAREAYLALAAGERADLLAFLDSLGGSSQKSMGLVPPDAPILEVGSLGGPDAPLSPSEEELFLRGREVFDRDVAASAGLGPVFNGDSCRACHFDPVIGGSGPDDVNVIRHGHLDGEVFTAPETGTAAPRFSIERVRPDFDEAANAFESRQPPPCFGLGFLESIPDEDILANDNCDDPTPGAITGCARILDSGKVGRLGWKANVPDLAEFSRDALTNEIGLTLPEVPGRVFGATEDTDGVDDPEIDSADIDALTFYMQRLAAPAPRSSDFLAEAAGEQIFEEVGCMGCHVADFATDDGRRPYTDLLLHAVLEPGDTGIGDGPASPLEFRTAPLWGLTFTAPYMHDGRAFTVEQAIAAHRGEAEASRLAFEALTSGDRADLLAFLASL